MGKLKQKFSSLRTKIQEFITSKPRNQTLSLLGILFLVVIIPVTVVVLGQQTNIFQHAAMINDGLCSINGNDGAAYCGTTSSTRYNLYQKYYTSVYCATAVKLVQTNSSKCGYFSCTGSGKYCSGVQCTAANGLQPASGTCPTGRYCCSNYVPKPTPTPINCSTYKGSGICVGTGNPKYPICQNANFYAGSSSCDTQFPKGGTVCCAAASVPVTYSCSSNTIVKGSDGTSATCSSGTVCNGPTATVTAYNPITNNITWAKSKLCKPPIPLSGYDVCKDTSGDVGICFYNTIENDGKAKGPGGFCQTNAHPYCSTTPWLVGGGGTDQCTGGSCKDPFNAYSCANMIGNPSSKVISDNGANQCQHTWGGSYKCCLARTASSNTTCSTNSDCPINADGVNGVCTSSHVCSYASAAPIIPTCPTKAISGAGVTVGTTVPSGSSCYGSTQTHPTNTVSYGSCNTTGYTCYGPKPTTSTVTSGSGTTTSGTGTSGTGTSGTGGSGSSGSGSGTTPTPTIPAGSGSIAINLIIGLPGIGFDGNNPNHNTRPVTVELYAATVAHPGASGTTPVKSMQGILTFDNTTGNNGGYFISHTPLSFSGVASGQYQILIKVPQYLYKLALNPLNSSNTHVFALNSATTLNLTPLILSTGDMAITNGEQNRLNLNDYNIIISCFGDKASSSSCGVKTAGSGGTNLADLNDDGKVDGIDLNIFLRSFRDLQAANAPGCDQFDCQGD